MTTATSICNQALYLLGQGRIDDIGDGSPTAVVCSEFYDQVRDEVLAHYPWFCAVKRAILAADAGSNLTIYSYRYRLPVDPYCLRVVHLIDGTTYTDLPYESFEVEGDLLLADVSPCAIKYIGRIADESKLSPWVIEQMIYLLAAKVSPRLVESGKKQQNYYALFLQKRMEGMQKEGMSRRSRTRPDTPVTELG